MLCARTNANTTNSTARTPGRVKTRRSGARLPAAWPAKSGTWMRTHAIRISASALMMPKHQRHPTTLPRKVPAGTPSDNASGVPTIAMAMARPF